ncbi:MAG: hypothetical protein BWK80_03145 [Desulfobacteraceae bacterium IS3]|nr:MAG: hypothetical protein BWK80_03145 [Desulfobacteraceae bacterium IS3]
MKTKILMFYFFILSLMTGADLFAAVDVTLKSADEAAVQHDFDLDIYMSGEDEVAIFRIYLEFDKAEIQVTGFTSHVGDDLLTPSVPVCNETGRFVLLYSSPNPFIPLPDKKVLTISCKTSDKTGVAGFRFFGRTYIKNSGFPPQRVTGVLTGKSIRIVPQPPMYKITASATPPEGGTISNAGENFYEAGETPEYAVTVNEGYEIKGFTVSSDINAKLTDNVYTFLPLEKDAVITVTFAKEAEIVPAIISASASPAEGGKIEPSGNMSVNIGADQTFRIAANTGWRTESITVDGNAAALNADGTYIFRNVDKNHSIAAVFAKEGTVIIASVSPDEGGKIEPSGRVPLDDGTTPTFRVTANSGWRMESVTVDGSPVTLTSNSTYTFGGISSGNHTITAFFVKESTVVPAIISASAGPAEGGKIEPSGDVSVNIGADQTFRVAANAGWRTEGITVDGNPASLDSDGTYIFRNVDKNHSIAAVFAKESTVVPAIINASAGPAEGGKIEPSGNVSVNIGADQTFRVAANTGWRTESITVDGNPAALDSDGTYTFRNVDRNHSIAAVFVKESAVVPAIINASASPLEGGRIEPSRDVVVTIGSDMTFTVIPNEGWRIETVTVDGNPVELEINNSYTFKDIQKNHIIKAFFIHNDVLLHTITASASPAEGGSIAPSGNVTVEDGNDQIFKIIVNEGWEIVAKVDGNIAALDSDGTYAFENVHQNFVFTVSFVKKEEKFHSADYDGDFHIGLRELIRVLQFYEFGGYHCAPDTEDGYAPLGDGRNCQPHDSDYENPAVQSLQDWKIELGELLRLVQFYNSDGGYRPDPSGEDGFVLGK